MKNQKLLIEKYYKGETSLDEENLLKGIAKIEDEDIYTHQMFSTFLEEKKEVSPPSVKIFSPPLSKPRRFTFYRKRWVKIATGTAACLLVAFGLLFYKYEQKNCAYVIINGVRINDEKLALQYINESFEEEERINRMALAQLEEKEKEVYKSVTFVKTLKCEFSQKDFLNNLREILKKQEFELVKKIKNDDRSSETYIKETNNGDIEHVEIIVGEHIFVRWTSGIAKDEQVQQPTTKKKK
jgi:hypothetical protein